MGHLAVRRLSSLGEDERARILARAGAIAFDPSLTEEIGEIVAAVRRDGDQAVSEALARFDRVECPPDRLRVGEEQVAAAARGIDQNLADAVRGGLANIRAFNERVLEGASWRAEIAPGIEAGEKAGPIDSAALFVPSGRGSFPSVLMQIGMPAVVAGVPHVAVLAPPSREHGGDVDPAVLFVAAELGLRDVFRVNGPAGIAAAAFGTESVPRVSRVVGPGSPAVVAAQIAVQAYGCSTVMLFGASESMIVADESADPRLLAADLLNEAEHGHDSAALLVTASDALVEAVAAEVEIQLERLPEPRRGFAASAISDFGGAFLAADLDEAVAFANDYAPEHLQLAVSEPDALLEQIEHAGEILLGSVPFAAANYVLGIPATLPTGRFARSSSGVTARTFVKTSSIGRASPDALAGLGPAVVALAEHEGFPAHAAAVRARLDRAGEASVEE